MKVDHLRKEVQLVTVICCVGIALASACLLMKPLTQVYAAQPEAMQDPVLRTLLAGIKNRDLSITTVEGYFVKEWYNNTDPAVQAVLDKKGPLKQQPVQVSQLFWAANGVKSREDERTIIPETPPYYTLKTYDGERVQVWTFGNPKAGEFPESVVPAPNQGAGPLQIPLGDKDAQISDVRKALEHQKIRFIGKESINGVETYKIESLPAADRSYTEDWWIAPSLGFVVLRNERRSSQPNPNERIASWRHVEIVDKLTKVGEGVWIPKVERHIVYLALKNQAPKETWMLMYRNTVLSLKVNEPVAPSLFDLPLPMGTTVGSWKGNGVTIVGGDVTDFKKLAQKGQPEEKAILDAPMTEPLVGK